MVAELIEDREHALASLIDEAARVRRSDIARCIELLDRAAALVDRQQDHLHAGRLHAIRGEVELTRGDLLGAITAYQLSRMAWLAAGRALEARGPCSAGRR
ncbi:hypothetical protein [Nocardioides humi]|uniref:hypothetical protein n=1 Tax=Nocardioides humi TaxID=449461 RepID=UPI0011269C50|nr:hypothetical protein [Nocardioides humi]